MNRKETAALAAKAKAGDRAAFETLYNEFSEKVFFFALRSTGSSEAARDITSETFVTALEHICELRFDESFIGWLFSIAYSKCVKYNKESSRTESFGNDKELDDAVKVSTLAEPIMLPEDYVSDKETREQLKAVIDGLPPELRSAVILYYYEDVSVAEVAKSLGVNENSAKHKLFRARSVIRKRIEKLFGSGALLAAVPMETLLQNTADASFEHASAVGAARVAGRSFAAKLVGFGTAAAVAVGVPAALNRLEYSRFGDYRPEDSSLIREIPVGDLYAINADDLRADVQAALAKKYDHIKLRKGITVDIPDELYERSFVQAEGMEKQYRQVFEKLYDRGLLAKVNIEYSDSTPEKSPEGQMLNAGFHDEKLKEHCYLMSNGFLCFFRPSVFDCLDPGKVVRCLHVDRGEGLNEMIDLDGGSITVGEAADVFQKWVNENYAYLEPDYTFKVKNVNVCSDDFGNCRLEAEVEKCLCGVHLESEVNKLSRDDHKMNYVTNTLLLTMKKPYEISMFTNLSGMILPDKKEIIESAVSLSSVLDHLDSKDRGIPEISSIGLKYTLSPDYDPSSGQKYYGPGITFESRLVWELKYDIAYSQDDERSCRCIQVDVLTGDIEYDL